MVKVRGKYGPFDFASSIVEVSFCRFRYFTFEACKLWFVALFNEVIWLLSIFFSSVCLLGKYDGCLNS